MDIHARRKTHDAMGMIFYVVGPYPTVKASVDPCDRRRDQGDGLINEMRAEVEEFTAPAAAFAAPAAWRRGGQVITTMVGLRDDGS